MTLSLTNLNLRHLMKTASAALLMTIGVITVLILVSRVSAIFYPEAVVVGASMTPGLTPGSELEFSAFFAKPERNGIYVIDTDKINHPSVKHQDGRYIKRIVGLPGDKLLFNLTRGTLIAVNGVNLSPSPIPTIDSHEITSKKVESAGVNFLVNAFHVRSGDFEFNIYEAESKAFSNDEKMESFAKLVFNFPWLKEQKHENELVSIAIPDGYYFALSDNRVLGIDSRHFGLVAEESIKLKYVP